MQGHWTPGLGRRKPKQIRADSAKNKTNKNDKMFFKFSVTRPLAKLSSFFTRSIFLTVRKRRLVFVSSQMNVLRFRIYGQRMQLQCDETPRKQLDESFPFSFQIYPIGVTY